MGSDDELDGLVGRARDGDEDALEELLARIRPHAVRRCAKFLPYNQDAEEAAQEALLIVSQRLSDFGGRGSFMGWVTVIASNSARQMYRTMRRRFTEQAVGELPVAVEPRTTSVIAGSKLDLLDAIDALEHVHPVTVQPFVLRDLGTLPYDDIADLTRTPVGTVKARIHTARGFVRNQLGGRADNS